MSRRDEERRGGKTQTATAVPAAAVDGGGIAAFIKRVTRGFKLFMMFETVAFDYQSGIKR